MNRINLVVEGYQAGLELMIYKPREVGHVAHLFL